jgi:hypothetical protein
MNKMPTKTGQRNRVGGIYHSGCHNGERTVLEGQPFPRCAYCNSETYWVFVRPLKSGKPQKQTTNP